MDTELELFKEMCKEMLPYMEAIKDILFKRGIAELASIAVASDGYMKMYTKFDGWQLTRVDDKHEPKVSRTITYGI